MAVHKLKRILIVDDDSDIRQMLKLLLRNEGYDIVGEASSGMELNKKIQKTQPGIILLDISMPGSSGLDVLEEIIQEFSDIKVVMISGSSSSADVQTAIKRGAVGYIVKPFNTNNVVQNVQRAIQVAVNERAAQKAS